MQHKQGFTFIELLIAVVLVGGGLLAMLLTNVNIQQASDRTYERVVATQDAHRTIEMMRTAAETGAFPVNVTAAFPQGAAVAGFNNLPSEQVVVSYQNQTADPLNVTVTTRWLEGGRRNSSIQLRTLITQRGR